MASSETFNISWGPWSRLPNGQWYREGQDSSGIWYEDNTDQNPLDPTLPRMTQELAPSFNDLVQTSDPNYEPASSYQQGPSLSYGYYEQDHGDYDQATVRHRESESKHTGKPPQTGSTYHAYDRGKSSRPSKSEFKGQKEHGKNSGSSRTDAKGKGKANRVQPVDLPTVDEDISDVALGEVYAGPGIQDVTQKFLAGSSQNPRSKTSSSYTIPLRTSRAQNIEPLVDHDPSSFQQSFQDVADSYLGGISGESSSSSTSIPAPGYHALAESDEQFDEVPERLGLSSYLKGSRSRTIREDTPLDEDGTKYLVRRSREFTFGTVFKCMWSEPMGDARSSRHHNKSLSEFGQRNLNGTLLYEGIRRFVVIDGTENGARNANSICVPIATYKKQGCTKKGANPQQHGVIYTQDKQPMLLNNEPDLGVAPIRLVVNSSLQGTERLAPEARINYSKHVTIEHNCPVHFIGKIHKEDLDTLAAGVDMQWERRVRSRKKDTKQRGLGRYNEQTRLPIKDYSSRYAETPRKLSGRYASDEPPDYASDYAPDDMRQDGRRPDHIPTEHLSSTYRPKPSSPDRYRDKNAKQGDDTSLSQKVGEKSAVIYEEPQEPHASEDSDLNVSETQELQEELDSRLDSLAISSNVIRDQSLHDSGGDGHSPGNIFLPNTSQSPESSICLTETPSDTSVTGPHLKTSQRRRLIVKRLIAYVTPLFQTRLPSRGENPRACRDSSSHQTHGDTVSSETGNQETPRNSGIRQPNPPDKKRKLNDQSDEEGSEEEEQASSQALKGKQKESQILFACPYIKRYRSEVHCKNNGWPSTARVKAHLYQRHQQAIHCPRCRTIFDDQDALDTHIRDVQCNPSDKARPRGFNKKQEKELRSRTGLCKMNEREKWQNVYIILFPGEQDRIPEPYFNPDEPFAGFNANQRRKITHGLYRLVKKLKSWHGENNESELKEEVLAKLVDNVLDGDADETCEAFSSDTCNEHHNGEGNAVGAENSPAQNSYQEATSTVEQPYVLNLIDGTDETSGPSWLGSFDEFEHFLIEGSMAPDWDPSVPDIGFKAADPDNQHFKTVDKHTSDSGLGSSIMNQGLEDWVLGEDYGLS